MNIEQAREAAAADYPEFITDTHGRKHECIARRAILKGAWDDGFVVRRHLSAAEVEKEGRG